ncbi:MAG: hypothetical protein DFNUSKGM_002851, partial [Candidatus Fervidibacter sacchari]
RKKMWLIGIVVRFTEFLFLISFTSVTIITRFSNTLREEQFHPEDETRSCE